MYFSADMMVGLLLYFISYNCLSILHQFLIMKKENGVLGDVNEHAAELLPYGKIQSIVFLTMLAPILQNILMILVFWRRSGKGVITGNPLISGRE